LDLNRLISYTLRIGVLASAFLGLAGLVAWAIMGSSNLSPISGSQVGTTIASAIGGNASGLIYLGVAVLVATPVFRVALSTFYFAHEGDKRYVLITLAVLSMLIIALLSGVSG
jgi:uncharacterized membrane protein